MEDHYFRRVYRSIDETFDYLGKRWTIQIIKGLFCGCKHFRDFLEEHPTLSSKVLSERLRELEDKGIIEKRILDSSSNRTEYGLTEKGMRLNRIIFELFNFALDEAMKDEDDSELRKQSKENLRACLIGGYEYED